jgi:hypothetical protein
MRSIGRVGSAAIVLARLLKSVTATAYAISLSSSSSTPAERSASHALAAAGGPERDCIRPNEIAARVRAGKSPRARSCSMRSIRSRLIPLAQSSERNAE